MTQLAGTGVDEPGVPDIQSSSVRTRSCLPRNHIVTLLDQDGWTLRGRFAQGAAMRRYAAPMSIPTDVKVNIEDSMSNSGMREVWPTTNAPTSPLWRYAFHEAATEKFGARWMGAGFVSCGADVAYTVPFEFNSILERAADIYTRAVQDAEMVKMLSDEADGKFPFLPEEGRYSIPSS